MSKVNGDDDILTLAEVTGDDDILTQCKIKGICWKIGLYWRDLTFYVIASADFLRGIFGRAWPFSDEETSESPFIVSPRTRLRA